MTLWLGTGHLLTSPSTPVFDDIMVGLFASTVHVVIRRHRIQSRQRPDFRRRAVRAHHATLFAGQANEQLFEIVRANVREPEQVVGDLYSLASGNDVGARRLRVLMREAGLGDLDRAGRPYHFHLTPDNAGGHRASTIRCVRKQHDR